MSDCRLTQSNSQKLALFLCLLYPCASNLMARPLADDFSGDFFDLTLADLHNMSVTVASVHEESILETPAIVSRYNRSDLEKLGIHDLPGMLSLIPGVVISTAPHGHPVVMIRGLSESFNQKVLFLIDDTPYWMAAQSDIPLLGVPMEAIDHIEVIRGPGSVYYGTNASAGVIKVVTKRGQAGKSLTIQTGSNQRHNAGGYFSHQFSEESNLSISFEKQTDDGFKGNFDNVISGDTASGSSHRSENFRSLLAQFSYADFKLMAQTYQSEVEGILPPGAIINQGMSRYKGYMAAGEYNWQLADINLKLFSDYNHFVPEFHIDKFFAGSFDAVVGFPGDSSKDYRWRSGVNINYPIHSALSLFAGAEYEKRSQGNFAGQSLIEGGPSVIINQAQRVTESSLFGQVDYMLDDWRFLIGARWVDNEDSGTNIMPRLSAVYRMDDKQSVKLLYSEGYNSPNFIQSGGNAAGIVAANATAETAQSIDLAYTYSDENSLLVANAYHLTLDDPIQRDFTSGVIIFTNGTEYNRYGAELDYQHQFNEATLLFNASYNHQGNKLIEGDKPALYVPRFTANLGLNHSWDRHTLGGAMQYISERAAADSLLDVTLNYQYNGEGYELFAAVHNLLDDNMQHPDMLNKNPSGLIPGADERNYQIGFRLQF